MVPLTVKIQITNSIALGSKVLDSKIGVEERFFQYANSKRFAGSITIERHTLVKYLENIGELHFVHVNKDGIFMRFGDVTINLEVPVVCLRYQEVINVETLALNSHL